MIDMIVWYIIKSHDSCIDDHIVYMGVISKGGFQLQIINVRGVLENCLDIYHYMVIIRKEYFNPN